MRLEKSFATLGRVSDSSVHMNGRVYDYNLGRFLSVDPFIQEPGNSQSMNPYSYIMNNPLAGTDPSGYAVCAASDNASCLEDGVNTVTDKDGNESTVIVGNKGDTVSLSNGKQTFTTTIGNGNKWTETSEIGSQSQLAQNTPNTAEATNQTSGYDFGESDFANQIANMSLPSESAGDQSDDQTSFESLRLADTQNTERTWGSYLPGTAAGDRAATYWANRLVASGGGFFDDPVASVGLFFSVLWTDQTAAETAFTLSTAGLSDITYFAKLGYYRYIGPNSNPASRWVFASTNSTAPYASMAAAKSALQLPSMPTAYKAVTIPWWKPVAGSRSVWRNPQWGKGGGKEWYQGWKFPD